MRFVRFAVDGRMLFGVVEGEDVAELDRSYLQGECARSGRRFPLDSVRLLCPTLPRKVVCVGLNYRDHAGEMGKPLPGEPCLFLKPPGSVIGPDDAIVYPRMTQRMDYEAELGVIIGKRIHNAGVDEALDAVLGYVCLNDVTARDLQARDGQWTRAKSFDTFCPIGPWITDDVSDPNNLEIELLLNGERRQHSNTNQFAFKVGELISFMSRVMTLDPGDAIATGTPSGIGPMEPGDTVEVRVEGIGTLRNYVVRAE